LSNLPVLQVTTAFILNFCNSKSFQATFVTLIDPKTTFDLSALILSAGASISTKVISQACIVTSFQRATHTTPLSFTFTQ
jgi:hypothetical protein